MALVGRKGVTNRLIQRRVTPISQINDEICEGCCFQELAWGLYVIDMGTENIRGDVEGCFLDRNLDWLV